MGRVSRLPDALLEHVRSPRNVGAPDAERVLRGEATNAACRDQLVLYLATDDGGRVSRAGFQATGCPACLALGSAATELAEGELVDGGLSERVADAYRTRFGEPSPLHRHALTLVREALEAAARLAR
jgi:NifU-like protein involved in Fe-S cluster formation